MLVIRDEQLRAFADGVRHGWVEERLSIHFPAYFDALPAPERARFVAEMSRRAARLGFTSDHEVYLFTTLGLVLGRDFDSDPKLTWVAPILNDTQGKPPREKIEALYAEAVRHLGTTRGDSGDA